MKFKILLLLLLSSSAFANEADECKIVEETADMIIQMRQGGIDLKKVFDYFKKDQTVIIGTKFDLNMYFRTFICALITASVLAFAVTKYLQMVHILEMETVMNHIFIYLILMILVILLSMVSISYMCSRQKYIELTDNKISILDAKKVSHIKLSYLILNCPQKKSLLGKCLPLNRHR